MYRVLYKWFSPRIFLWGLCFRWVCACACVGGGVEMQAGKLQLVGRKKGTTATTLVLQKMDQWTSLFKTAERNSSLLPTHHNPKKPALCVWSTVRWIDNANISKYVLVNKEELLCLILFLLFFCFLFEITAGMFVCCFRHCSHPKQIKSCLFFVFKHSTSGWTFRDWDKWETVQVVSSTQQTFI